METRRRLFPLLMATALAFAGIALGAQLQRENALPADLRSQQVSNERSAAGDLVLLTGLMVATGTTWGLWALAGPAQATVRWKPLLAVFLGSYLAINLLQTTWPYYVSLDSGTSRQSVLHVNLLAANTAALPSVLSPVFAAWTGAILLVLWGARNLMRPGPPRLDGDALRRRHAGTLLLASPFLSIAAVGCLRVMVSLPPIAGATAYRVLMSLAALAFLGLLLAGALKAWHLMRAHRDPRMGPIALEAWEGLGRLEVGLAGLLGALAVATLFVPHVQSSALLGALQSGQTFVTQQLHVHFWLLMTSLVPLVPMVAIHKAGKRYLEPSTRNAQGLPNDLPERATPLLVGGLGATLAAAAVLSIVPTGALWSWAAAALPAAIVSRTLAGPVRHAQAILLAAWATWCLGNSLSAQYDAGPAGLQYASNPSMLELWRLMGALLATWAVTRLVWAASKPMRASVAIPLLGGTAVSALAILLLEFPLHIWANTWTDLGTARPPSVFVGTEVASYDVAASVTVHILCLLLSIGAALMVARLVRPEWFGRRRLAQSVPAAGPSLA